jgi:hydroxymethylpyrimidine pyrophosphatase-like HAD family hydrolase
MKNLIVPMGGKSSRFPSMRPKWMLSHPMTNRFMVIESISGINLEFFDKIYFIFLQKHEDEYHFHKGFLEELEECNLVEKSKSIFLTEQTSSQSETVYTAIKKENIGGFIFIKDSDGYYECNIQSGCNQIAFFDLNDMDDINARTKSYIEFDVNGIVINIVEKKVISSTFSVGGYGFESALEFCNVYDRMKDIEGECYVSNVIFEMILSGCKFVGLKTSNFKDWGTIDAWNKYKLQYKCLFVDIDGTLVTNSSYQFPPYIGDGISIENNITLLRKLHSSGKVKIILTTSRPKRYEQKTIKELKEKNIPFDELIAGLPHCQRIIINDFAKSNPYPSCQAINLPRNSDNLKEFLK